MRAILAFFFANGDARDRTMFLVGMGVVAVSLLALGGA